MTEELLKHLRLSCDMTDTVLTESQVVYWLNQLSQFNEKFVIQALDACCCEVRGRIYLCDVISRARMLRDRAKVQI